MPEGGEATPGPGAAAAGPTLEDLASLAALLQEATEAAGGDGGPAGAARLAPLRSGWRAWLQAGGGESALLRSVLDAVGGWNRGTLSRPQFELAINRLWAAHLDGLSPEAGAGERP